MDRRSFLRSIAVAAAGVSAHTLDVDRLLWQPGAKTIFLPPPPTLAVNTSGFALGDIITIDGYYAINPLTGESVQFVPSFDVLNYARRTCGLPEVKGPRKGSRGYRPETTWRPLGMDWKTT